MTHSDTFVYARLRRAVMIVENDDGSGWVGEFPDGSTVELAAAAPDPSPLLTVVFTGYGHYRYVENLADYFNRVDVDREPQPEIDAGPPGLPPINA